MLALNLFLFFIAWGTFQAGEDLLQTTTGVSSNYDIYLHYGLGWLFYAVALFGGLGGIALIYAIWRAKPWGYWLGFAWLTVGAMETLFLGIVAYLNKPLMIEIFKKAAESRGRNVADVEAFVHSSAFELTMVVVPAVTLCIVAFFAWQFYRRRAYFAVNSSDTLSI